MKWVPVQTASETDTYELILEGKKVLRLVHHPLLNTTRIEYANTRRMFMIDRVGFLRRKSVLKNEYGVKVGQLITEKWNSPEGTIEFDNKKFNYVISNNSSLSLYQEGKEKAILTCDLGQSSDKKTKTASYTHFLLGLCWSLFVPSSETAQAQLS